MSNIHVKDTILKEINEKVPHREDTSWSAKIEKLLDMVKGE